MKPIEKHPDLAVAAWGPALSDEQNKILNEMVVHLVKFMTKGMMGRLGTFGEVRTLFSVLVMRAVVHRTAAAGNSKENFKRLIDDAFSEEWDHWASVFGREES